MRRTKRAARRVHPPVESALDSINALVTHSRSVQTNSRRNLRSRSIENPPPKQSSRTKSRNVPRGSFPRSSRERQTSTDNRKRPRKSNHGDPPFLESPSNVWQRLPLAHRVLSFLLGFLSLYYFVFAKHHHYDREIVAIHSDVENLMRHVRNSDFGKDLVEAEVPAIFKEAPTPSPSPTPKKKYEKKGKDGDPGDKLPLKEKKRKRKKKAKKKNAAEGKSDSSSSTKAGIASPSQNVSQDSSTNSIPEENTVESNTHKVGTRGPSDEGGSVGASSSPINTSAKSIPHRQANNTMAAGNDISTVTAVDAAVTGTGNGTGSESAERPPPASSQNGIAATASAPLAAPEMNRGRIDTTNRSSDEAATASYAHTKQELYDYSNEFKDIEANDSSIPKGHVPLLDWNYEAVIDPETAEQIFGIGDKLDHVAVYKPLCINPANEEAIIFTGKKVCSGFNRTAGWLWQYCSVMKESLKNEYLLSVSNEEKPKEWLKEKESSIHWVNGLTVLQVLEKNCGNIAHFSGRALMLQHIIENIAAYAAPPSTIENVLIVPTYHIMKRFLYPHNYGFWHKSLLTALVAPAHYTIGTLGNFLYREHKDSYNGTQRVQLLHNFSISGSVADGKEYVCFRRAIVPGYLKARFFVDDVEYPSMKPSLQSPIFEAPQIPRDSLRLRERVSAVFHQTPKFPNMKKEIVFLDRTGSRRVFAEETKAQIMELFKKVSSEKGYTLKVVSFNNMTFTEQYNTMEGVALAAGIHGANLVNTMFMPPLAVLIELFPFGFMHDMYINGGNAGLKYFKYQMATGLPFKGPKMYRTVEQCIKYNRDCKVHYRDSVLQVTPSDLTALETLLRQAVDWCDSILKSSASNGSSKSIGSKRRRRRRLLHDRMNKRQKALK